MPKTSKKCLSDFEAKCKVLFDEANDGNPVSPGQLCRVIRKALPNFKGTDQDIAQMFLEIDDDSDKEITWEEFSEALFAKDPKEVTRAELEGCFKAMDADGSGKLDRAEVKKLLEEQEVPFTEEGLNNLMEKADPNGDGVDVQEFLREWAAGDD